MKFGLKRNNILNEVILKEKDNVVYVDFVLVSMVNTIDKWYDEHCKQDKYHTNKRSHKFNIIRFYDRKRFLDYRTIGNERKDYMKEIDLHMQMRRND
jgi:hypothetical protein